MKINNSFNDEFKNPIRLASDKLKELKIKKYNSKIAWIIFSVAILVLNITVLTMAIIGIIKVINAYNANPDIADFTSQVLPTIGVSIVSIMIFVLTITIAIYEGTMKSSIYLSASENIQYLTIKYMEGQISISEAEFQDKINKIYKAAVMSKKKVAFGKTLLTIMTGGNNG
ncbi:hypothetical protein [Candidatus Mycoplasma mahonii]|uniref:hypothetical protein n=1 Tax=Candidatus Mycoplasma mahonii TaxID=3004105 RepID=UPI0026F2173A|nr:hypothetical protein [Candidatus Mycoplasma mahonii]WKX02811.1 hypothetical protein O3I44_01930 [Candidatus Mycoplasma mahonii]